MMVTAVVTAVGDLLNSPVALPLSFCAVISCVLVAQEDKMIYLGRFDAVGVCRANTTCSPGGAGVQRDLRGKVDT